MSKNPIPQGKYKPAVRYGNLIFTAGMTPRKDGVLLMSGKISPDRPLDEYRDAVIQAASNALTAAQNTLGEGEKIVQILFFFNDTATTEIYTIAYTLSLHDALPICRHRQSDRHRDLPGLCGSRRSCRPSGRIRPDRSPGPGRASGRAGRNRASG